MQLFTIFATSIALLGYTSAVPLENAPRSSGMTPVYKTCHKDGLAAITMDDGVYKYHSKIQHTFDDAGVKATFAINGNNYGCIYDYADQIRSSFDNGHQLISHTWSHADVTSLSEHDLNKELGHLENAFKKILGVKPKGFRPPFGNINNQAREILAQRGYTQIFLWDEDTGDSVGKSESYQQRQVQKMIDSYPSPHMLLSHEVFRTTTGTVLPEAIKGLQNAGYSLVTAGECTGTGSDASDWYEEVGGQEERNDSWTC